MFSPFLPSPSFCFYLFSGRFRRRGLVANSDPELTLKEYIHTRKYKVVQIWPGRFVWKQVTLCPGHIWTTLYDKNPNKLAHLVNSLTLQRVLKFQFWILAGNLTTVSFVIVFFSQSVYANPIFQPCRLSYWQFSTLQTTLRPPLHCDRLW
jgi:hypothetical protein